MPKGKYLRPDGTLKTAGRLLSELDRTDSSRGKTFWECARKSGPRIRKFARYPRTLKKWQLEFNEPSHLSVAFRAVDKLKISDFVSRAKILFDEKDKYLLVAMANEIYSDGKIKAILAQDGENTPGIHQKLVLSASNIHRNDKGELTIKIASDHTIISNSKVPRGPWPGVPVIVQGTHGILNRFQVVTKAGEPVDMSNFEKILLSLSKTKGQRISLQRRLRQLGFSISFNDLAEDRVFKDAKGSGK